MTRLVVTDASTISSGALPLAVLVAVAAGLVSFASPCVLPLVPGFLGYVTGLSDVALAQRRTSRMVLGAALFVLGFTVVFILGAVAVSAAGAALATRQGLLTRIGGAVVIVFALVFLGVGGRLGSQREVRTHWRPAAGLAGAPCSARLSPSGGAHARDRPSAPSMPLPPRSRAMRRWPGEWRWRRHTAWGWGCPSSWRPRGGRGRRGPTRGCAAISEVQLAGGGLLLVLGLLMVSGLWEGIMSWVQAHLVTGFETLL